MAKKKNYADAPYFKLMRERGENIAPLLMELLEEYKFGKRYKHGKENH